MKYLLKILYAMDHFVDIIGRLCKYLIFVILGILLIEVFLRYVLNQPTQWSIELGTFIFGAYFFLAGGYVLGREGHVRMDILYSKWSRKKQKLADIVTFPLFAVYLCVFIYGGISNIQYSLKFNQHSRTMWGPPLAPIKMIITAGALLLLIKGVTILIRDVLILFDKSSLIHANIAYKNKETKL